MRRIAILLLMLLSAAAHSEVWQARYGVAETFDFKLYNADGTLDVDEADGGTEVSLSCNEGAETTATNDFVDEGTFYSIALTATEMQCERIAVVVAATTTEVFFIQTSANASAMTPAYDANVTQFGGTAGTFASGRPEVNTTHIAGSAVSTSSAQIGVNVVNAGGTAWGSGAITAASIATDAIGAAEIADGAIDAGALATDTITAAKIAADAIAASEIAADAIGAAEIANAAIDAATFAAGAIDASAIATDAIGAAEIAADAIGASELATDAIGAAELAANAIAAAEVADGAIDEATFATTAGSFDALGIIDQGTAQAATSTTLQLRSAAAFADDEIIGATCLITGGSAGVGQARPITDYVSSTDTATVATWTTTPTGTITYECFGTSAGGGSVSIAAGGITASSFATGAIDAAAIAADAIGAAELAADSITASEIATDAIGASELAASAIGASELADGGITSAEFGTGAITATVIAADAIGASELAADAITSSEIADGAVDAGALATDTITAAKIAADAVGASEIANAAIDAATFAAAAIDASAIATDAIGNAELAADAGAGLSSIPWNASWDSEVQSEAADALAAIFLDQLLANTYDPATPPGAVDSLLEDLVENDAGVTRFSVNALEQGPSGGGGVADWTADERTAIRAILGIPGSGTTPADPTTGILDTIRDYVDTEVATLVTNVGTPTNLGSGASLAANNVDIEGQTDDIGAAGAGLTAADDAVMTRLGTPAGASVSADVAAIEDQTDDIGVAGAGLTATDDAVLAAIAGLNNLSAAQIRDQIIEDQGGGVVRGCFEAVLLAFAAGDITTTGGTTTWRDPSNGEVRITSTVTSNGNRTASITCPTY